MQYFTSQYQKVVVYCDTKLVFNTTLLKVTLKERQYNFHTFTGKYTSISIYCIIWSSRLIRCVQGEKMYGNTEQGYDAKEEELL